MNIQQKFNRAAQLSQCDLLTWTVRNDIKLHGYMGMCMALNDGQDIEVAIAIYQAAQLQVPKTYLGRLLSIADKITTISGLIAVGGLNDSQLKRRIQKTTDSLIRILADDSQSLRIIEV